MVGAWLNQRAAMNPFAVSLPGVPFPLPDISPFLTKGTGGTGVTLRIGDVETWLLLGGGIVLIVAALVLVKVMNSRIKFFAREFGKGRFRTLFPYLFMGTLLFLAGAASAWVGWQAMGYSVTLDPTGLTERTRGGTTRYPWEQAESASDRIKSTEFWVSFTNGVQTCRVTFQQRHIGEFLQDKAIQITEAGLAHGAARRVQSDSN